MNRSSPHNIGIIAGNGLLPYEVAQELTAAGNRLFILSIEGEADERLTKFPGKVLSFGQLGEVFASLRRENIKQVLFVGGVKKRPDFSAIKMDWKTVKSLPKILALLASGDNSLLSGVVAIFEKEGFEVQGIKNLVPKILTKPGLLVGKNPSKKTTQDIQIGMQACNLLGTLDCGQAAVAENGRIIALEAAEGTDAMLDRVAALRKSEQISKSGTGGILVKTKKPGQEERMDLPAIGPETVLKVSRAGLAGIALEANETIILDRRLTFEAANQHDIFIIGVTNNGDV